MGDSLGGGVIIAVAAVLWLAYLLPSWYRRREYLSTERNAVRLQQTIRAMAGTAAPLEELPAEKQARELAARRKALQEELKRTEAIARAERMQRERIGKRGEPVPSEATRIAARKASDASLAAAQRSAQEVSQVSHDQAARLRRRNRLVTSVFLLAGVVAAVVGGVQLALGAGWLLLAAGLGAVALAVATLRRMASVAARARDRRSGSAPVARPRGRRIVLSDPLPQAEQDEDRTWTPSEVPKPLYLSRTEVRPKPVAVPRPVVEQRPASPEAPAAPVAPAAVVEDDPQAELRHAALAAERALRAAHQAPEVAAFEAPGGMPDLDAVLRRRSAG